MPTQASVPPGVADVRRIQMLQAAVEVIEERGFPETRITDVAERAGVSPALVIYYFATKDNLLVEALRYAEGLWYEAGAERVAGITSARDRLASLVSLSCIPEGDGPMDSWVLWLDLWAQAVRHPAVASVRDEFDQRWRDTLAALAAEGQASGEFDGVDPEHFALVFSVLLDGLAVQIALRDATLTPEVAFELAMGFAGGQLGFSWQGAPARRPRRRSSRRP